MTKRLYYDDPELIEWDTRITGAVEKEDGWYALLAESAFYPHGGGQLSDTGTINGVRVLDVIADGDLVLHKLEAALPEGPASCRIDAERRFDHRQQHSGQHLLSAVCLKLFGAKTLSFHMGADASTIDIERPSLSADELALLEREVNGAVFRDHRIQAYWVSGDEAARLPLVKPPQVAGDVRIVEIEGIEYNACGGTHVSSTGAIGTIKLLRTEKMKGNVRITFLCGTRTLAEFNRCLEILGKLSAKFNTGKDEILDRLAKGEQEQKLLQEELAAAKEQLDAYLIQELLERRETGVIAHIFDRRSMKDMQNTALRLTAETDLPVLLADRSEGKVVLACGGGGTLSCGGFMKEHLGAFGGKGGGSAAMAQAGFGSAEQALAFFEFAREALSRI